MKDFIIFLMYDYIMIKSYYAYYKIIYKKFFENLSIFLIKKTITISFTNLKKYIFTFNKIKNFKVCRKIYKIKRLNLSRLQKNVIFQVF